MTSRIFNIFDIKTVTDYMIHSDERVSYNIHLVYMQVNGNPIQTHVKLTHLKWLLQKKSAYSFDITESSGT